MPVVASSAAQRSRWLEQSRPIDSRLVHAALSPAQRRLRSDSVMGKTLGPVALESVRSSLACAMTASALTPARSTRLAKSTGRSAWLMRKAVTFGWSIKMRCRPRSRTCSHQRPSREDDATATQRDVITSCGGRRGCTGALDIYCASDPAARISISESRRTARNRHLDAPRHRFQSSRNIQHQCERSPRAGGANIVSPQCNRTITAIVTVTIASRSLCAKRGRACKGTLAPEKFAGNPIRAV